MDTNQVLQDKVNQEETILKPAEVMMGGIKTTFEQGEKIINADLKLKEENKELKNRVLYLEDKIRELGQIDRSNPDRIMNWYNSIEGI